AARRRRRPAFLSGLDPANGGAFYDEHARPCRGGLPVIDELVAAFALTLARTATFIHVLPLLGGANMPRTVKAGLAVAITVVFFPGTSGALGGANGAVQLGLTSWLG